MDLNQRMPRVDTSRFSMVPRADIPRSMFRTQHTHKSTFNASFLIPIHVDEVLPGDVHQGRVTIFARLATPVFPIMDRLSISTFFFFAPARLLWENFPKMMGERANPTDSISYTVPVINATNVGLTPASIYDYMGIPVAGQLTGTNELTFNALPFRAYNFVWNEWFRDENLQQQIQFLQGDGPDAYTVYTLLRRNKQHDYITSALPWPIKGGVDINALGASNTPVKGIAIQSTMVPGGAPGGGYQETGGTSTGSWTNYYATTAAGMIVRGTSASTGAPPNITVDVTTTVNALRLAFQTQRLLERDARSGTRFTEILRAHFGINPEDVRLQRPEYIGGGKTAFQTQAIPYTAQDRNTSTQAINNPVGSLGATALASDQHSFTYRAKEHGYILGLACVHADITYQQGLHRMWTRQTRYDFYWPVFANLGEQAVRNDEVYANGMDSTAFGYQERWAEYRHRPSRISGLFRGTSTGNIDEWHMAEVFASAPALNAAFITDKTYEQLQRVQQAGINANNMQILFDSVFDIRCTRPLPMYSVPGNIDRL